MDVAFALVTLSPPQLVPHALSFCAQGVWAEGHVHNIIGARLAFVSPVCKCCCSVLPQRVAAACCRLLSQIEAEVQAVLLSFGQPRGPGPDSVGVCLLSLHPSEGLRPGDVFPPP